MRQRKDVLYAVDDQYMMGDRMMVAPLFAAEPARRVVLPEGDCARFLDW